MYVHNIWLFLGDHVAVYPINDSNLVERLGNLTDSNLDEVFSLINTDQESSKKHPFPCPTSYRTALSHYLEITALPRTHIMRELAEYCSDEEVSIFNQLLSNKVPTLILARQRRHIGRSCKSLVSISHICVRSSTPNVVIYNSSEDLCNYLKRSSSSKNLFTKYFTVYFTGQEEAFANGN